MLHLKRITDPYFACKCDITKKLIAYGDYYYEDDEDGFIVDYNYYYDRKKQQRMEQALNNPEIAATFDSISYKTMMWEAERQMLDRSLFKRKLASDVCRKGENKDAR